MNNCKCCKCDCCEKCECCGRIKLRKASRRWKTGEEVPVPGTWVIRRKGTTDYPTMILGVNYSCVEILSACRDYNVINFSTLYETYEYKNVVARKDGSLGLEKGPWRECGVQYCGGVK